MRQTLVNNVVHLIVKKYMKTIEIKMGYFILRKYWEVTSEDGY